MIRNKSYTKRTAPWLWLLLATTIWVGFYGCSRKSDDIPTVPETISGLIEQGWEAYQNGDYEAAVTHFVETLARDVSPEMSIDAYRGLGWTYSRLEKYAQAVTNFNFVISLESVRSGRFPVISKENVIATSTDDALDLGWNGEFQLATDEFIVTINDIESYSARQVNKLGPKPEFILPAGTSSINLPKSKISNSDQDQLGDALDNSLSFTPDTLNNAVASVEDIVNSNDYYLDASKGVVYIKPRLNPLAEMSANYTYHEKGYLVLNYHMQSIILDVILEDLSKAPKDEQGDIYYMKGDFYNRYDANDPTTGGTYLQADAYAGMTAAYLAQGDYTSALQAVRALIYVNQDLKALDAGNYPYKRHLFEGDDDLDMWDYYKMMAICYFNLKDYWNAKHVLESALLNETVIDLDKTEFAYDLIQTINELSTSAPPDWTPVDIF